MKFFLRYKKLHSWLMALAAFFAAYFSLRRSRTAMNWLCGRILLPLEQGIGRLCGAVSVSVAEVLIISALCAAFFYTAHTLRCLVKNHRRRQTLYRFAMTSLCSIATVYALFCLFWGSFYNTDSFQERAGITARGGTVAELTELSEYFAALVCRTAEGVPRDAGGSVVLDTEDVFAETASAYEELYDEFPFLEAQVAAPKAFAASRAMSALDFTGFYFPMTGEANINVDVPQAYLPATCCHERAHQLGFSSEQECNFLGVLAALRSESGAFRYSGALMGYVYVSNALYRTDREAWQRVRDTLPETARQDLAQQSAYWAQFEGPVRTVSNKVYDGFLKSNGDESGIRSYGTVVDLLLAYDWEGYDEKMKTTG